MREHKESSDDGYISVPVYREERCVDRRNSERKVLLPSNGSAFVAVKNTKYDQLSNFSNGMQK